MEWLTEYIDVVLPVALVLLFLFQRMFVRDEEEGPPAGDSDTQEEARRIQEEIRRKIVARQQGRTEPHQEEAVPSAYEEPERQTATFPRRHEEPRGFYSERPTPPKPPPVRHAQPQAAPATPGANLQDQLQAQRERLREARKAKEEAVKRTAAKGLLRAAEEEISPYALAGADLRSQLLGDLYTGDSMKRAFLLKEVVDRPIGLRDRADAFSNWV